MVKDEFSPLSSCQSVRMASVADDGSQDLSWFFSCDWQGKFHSRRNFHVLGVNQYLYVDMCLKFVSLFPLTWHLELR